MFVEERLIQDGGMWWFMRKIFVEEIDVEMDCGRD